MIVYAMRMAAVFTIATSTILLRTRLAPRWLVVAGYAIGIALLLAVGFFAWIELAFPAWVLVLSVYVLVAGGSRERIDGGETEGRGAVASDSEAVGRSVRVLE